MSDTIQFDLVSPERMLASLLVNSVQVPGSEGDITAMAGHMHLVTTLRPGILTVNSEDGEQKFVVTGGFAEVSEGITVLAEKAIACTDMTKEDFDIMLEDAQSFYNQTKENPDSDAGLADEASKNLSDMVAVGEKIGFN